MSLLAPSSALISTLEVPEYAKLLKQPSCRRISLTELAIHQIDFQRSYLLSEQGTKRSFGECDVEQDCKRPRVEEPAREEGCTTKSRDGNGDVVQEEHVQEEGSTNSRDGDDDNQAGGFTTSMFQTMMQQWKLSESRTNRLLLEMEKSRLKMEQMELQQKIYGGSYTTRQLAAADLLEAAGTYMDFAVRAVIAKASGHLNNSDDRKKQKRIKLTGGIFGRSGIIKEGNILDVQYSKLVRWHFEDSCRSLQEYFAALGYEGGPLGERERWKEVPEVAAQHQAAERGLENLRRTGEQLATLDHWIRTAEQDLGEKIGLPAEEVAWVCRGAVLLLKDGRNSDVHTFGIWNWVKGSKGEAARSCSDERIQKAIRPQVVQMSLQEIKKKKDILLDILGHLGDLPLYNLRAYRYIGSYFLRLLELAVGNRIKTSISRSAYKDGEQVGGTYVTYYKGGLLLADKSLEILEDGSMKVAGKDVDPWDILQ